MSGFKDFLVNRLLRERLGCRFSWLIRHEQDLRLPLPHPQARIPLTFREVKEKDLPAFLSFVAPELLPELSRRLRDGHICVGAYHQGRAICFSWLNPNLAHETSTGLQFPLKPSEIYSYHKLVDPAYRNLGVSVQLDWERNRNLAAQGFRYKVSLINRGNYAARRTAGKAGSRPAGHLIFIQIFGLRFSVKLPLAKLGTPRLLRIGGRMRGKSPGGTRGVP